MILSSPENANNYIDISTELDFLKPVPKRTRTEVFEKSYWRCSKRNFLPSCHSPESHRKYLDVPVTMNVIDQVTLYATDSAP